MKYRCSVCGHIYDEANEKVLFKDLSDDWVCPLCGAPKDLFEPLEENLENKLENKQEVNSDTISNTINKDVFEMSLDENNVEVTAGELAIIMSNLARGCEKQYKSKEQGLYLSLKDYFNNIKKNDEFVDKAKVEDLVSLINDDLNNRYKKSNEVAKENSDRGALRALTWSTKVSTMLKSLLEKYEREGEKMLEGKHIYVCTVCGFVYVGEKVPELCPVCKVPSFKFEEVM